jgi:hypothetical protein
VRVDHSMLVMPEIHPCPLETTVRSLVMVATLHPKWSGVKEATMQPLMTETVRCDERSHLKCNRSLDDYVLFEFEQYV